MSTIGDRIIIEESIGTFLTTYSTNPKPIFFWDTCGLLEIIRFVYRNNNGISTLNSILELANMVTKDEIYCVTSELAAIEWDDNVDKVLSDTKEELQQTEEKHHIAVEAINSILMQSLYSAPISTFRLEEVLKDIALNIAQASHFILYKDIAEATLTRVAAKAPPAREKESEIKDCAMWETMMSICQIIKDTIHDGGMKKVFYTVNTRDFADKSRGAEVFFHELQSEARMMEFGCALIIDDAVNALQGL